MQFITVAISRPLYTLVRTVALCGPCAQSGCGRFFAFPPRFFSQTILKGGVFRVFSRLRQRCNLRIFTVKTQFRKLQRTNRGAERCRRHDEASRMVRRLGFIMARVGNTKYKAMRNTTGDDPEIITSFGQAKERLETPQVKQRGRPSFAE